MYILGTYVREKTTSTGRAPGGYSTCRFMAAGETNNLFYQEVLVDGGPENYKKWAKSYEDDVKALKYAAYKNVSAKWRSYHSQLLSSNAGDGTSIEHKVFDAGCGTGLVGEQLASFVSSNVEIYGGDLSSDMIEVSKTKKVYTDLKVVNLKEQLPYEADSFDSIVCAGTFLQGHCGPESLPNLIRVLKKGCYLIASVRKAFYDETRSEWEKNVEECNCKLLEEVEESNLIVDAKGLMIVIYKQ